MVSLKSGWLDVEIRIIEKAKLVLEICLAIDTVTLRRKYYTLVKWKAFLIH